jgi:hypothetical protein
MRLYSVFILALLAGMITCLPAHAQEEGDDRVLILLDGSAAMKMDWGMGKSKYDAASQAIIQLIDSIYSVNADVQFGLRLFGNQYPEGQANCKDSRLEVRYTKDNVAQMALRLKDLQPRGVAALPYGLQEALKNDVTDTHYRQSIIVITGDVYSCKGEMCKMISDAKIDFYRLYVMDYAGVGFELKNCVDRVFQVKDEGVKDVAVSLIASQFVRNKKKPLPVVVAPPVEVVVPAPVIKKDPPVAKLAVKLRPMQVKPLPAPAPMSLKIVPDFKMPVIEPEPQPEVVEEVIANEPEPDAEIIEEPAVEEPPVRSTGALLFISSGTVTDLKIYRIHRGDDVYVKRLKITSAGRQEIELENGSYKMTYLLQDGTEITQPFRIEGDYSTEVIAK